jgi:acyl-CoA thioesterase-1
LIRLSREGGAEVLLVGMRIPPNYGPTYTREFHALFGELAKLHEVALVPFLLDGIALDDSLMQEDGIHPNAAAQPKLLAQVWPRLEPLLTQAETRASGTGARQ